MLNSPLTGTLGVMVGLALLAIPLHHLTSSPPAASPQPVTAATSASTGTPGLLRLKLLTPATHLRLTTPDGASVLELTATSAGESEHDVILPLHDGHLELTLEAEFGTSSSDTAVFLTVMPDGREDQTHYLIGSGSVAGPLTFEWKD
jgi:hypothetical protein